MNIQKFYPVLIIAIITGCAGVYGISNLDSQKEHDLRAGNIPGSLHTEWMEADRCTKCHMVWSWEFGYYRSWDRHGFISDYFKSSPFGYKDPYGLDASADRLIEYYFTDWWNGPWLTQDIDFNPPMHFYGYDRINDGTSQPEDFDGNVIVVDQSGKGDAKKIQEAVDKAQPGTTIFVGSGTYNESVKLKEGIRLWGENVYTTIINPDLKDSAIIAANNCDISGFTLTGTGMNYKNYNFSSGVHAIDCDSTLVIRGNFFDSNAVYGILVESSRVGGTSRTQSERYIKPEDALKNIKYTGYSNPRIIGNTFYMIGERAVYCIHSAPEIANNVFIGNVKTVGMTQHSLPFIHNNVFYRNNVSFNINRSMPVVSYNIMIQNYWGQRIIEGSRPFFHNNVTWESPYYKGFAEDGSYNPYQPFPGNGELELNPGFVDADAGDFRFAKNSPLASRRQNRIPYGLVHASDIQQPPVIACERSYAEQFLCRTDDTRKIIAAAERQNSLINDLSVSYIIDYNSYMEVKYDQYGDQVPVDIRRQPVSGMHYEVPIWIMHDGMRRKTYKSELFTSRQTLSDSGTVIFDGENLNVLSGRFKQYCKSFFDPFNVGEKPGRENSGGLYLDYDQYLNGAVGPGGTFYYGYLRILGGETREKSEIIDGHECIVVRYPNLGSDQFYLFYLDPELEYRPRKIEHYFERELYRKIDEYIYKTVDGVHLPVSVTITDYAVKAPHIGKIVGTCTMNVNQIRLNEGSEWTSKVF